MTKDVLLTAAVISLNLAGCEPSGGVARYEVTIDTASASCWQSRWIVGETGAWICGSSSYVTSLPDPVSGQDVMAAYCTHPIVDDLPERVWEIDRYDDLIHARDLDGYDVSDASGHALFGRVDLRFETLAVVITFVSSDPNDYEYDSSEAIVVPFDVSLPLDDAGALAHDFQAQLRYQTHDGCAPDVTLDVMLLDTPASP